MALNARLAVLLLAAPACVALRVPMHTTVAVDPSSSSRRSLLAATATLLVAPASVSASVVEEAKAVDAAATERNAIGSALAPRLTAKSKSINLVAKVTVTAPAPGDQVEYIYLKDVATGAVIGASKASSTLVTSVDKGKRVVPVVAYKSDGVWDGAPVDLSPGFDRIE